MGYAITGGIGLFGVLGCIIWALVERSRCRSAQLCASDETKRALKAEGIAVANVAAVAAVQAELGRSKAEAESLAARLADFRKRLEACSDPEAVKAWLDELGKGGPA